MVFDSNQRSSPELVYARLNSAKLERALCSIAEVFDRRWNLVGTKEEGDGASARWSTIDLVESLRSSVEFGRAWPISAKLDGYKWSLSSLDGLARDQYSLLKLMSFTRLKIQSHNHPP